MADNISEEAKAIVNTIMRDHTMGKEEWLEFERYVAKFFKSKASKADKAYVAEYTECLVMICSSFK